MPTESSTTSQFRRCLNMSSPPADAGCRADAACYCPNTAFLSDFGSLSNFSSQARSITLPCRRLIIRRIRQPASPSTCQPVSSRSFRIFHLYERQLGGWYWSGGTTIAGALFATRPGETQRVCWALVRLRGGTAEAARLFYTAVPYGQASTSSAWVFWSPAKLRESHQSGHCDHGRNRLPIATPL